MTETPLENFLAQLYTDTEIRARFLLDPAGEAQRAGLSPANCAAVLKINPTELRLAARSFDRKRHKRVTPSPRRVSFLQRWIGRLRKSAKVLPSHH